MRQLRPALTALSFVLWVAVDSASAQVPRPAPSAQPAPPAATRLEGFHPDAGTIVTLGYSELGSVSGVSVDVRELRAARTGTVRGLLVEITQGEYRQERSFVDADEIPELVRGVDAILAVGSNPTSFQQFEVRYTTRGELQLTAFNNTSGNISYSVRAGRITTAQKFISTSDLQRLRTMFVAAQEKISSLAAN
jgi:hypothetical protein